MAKETNLLHVSKKGKKIPLGVKEVPHLETETSLFSPFAREQTSTSRNEPALEARWLFSLGNLTLHRPKKSAPCHVAWAVKSSLHLRDTVDGDKLPSPPAEGAFKAPQVVSPKR